MTKKQRLGLIGALAAFVVVGVVVYLLVGRGGDVPVKAMKSTTTDSYRQTLGEFPLEQGEVEIMIPNVNPGISHKFYTTVVLPEDEKWGTAKVGLRVEGADWATETSSLNNGPRYLVGACPMIGADGCEGDYEVVFLDSRQCPGGLLKGCDMPVKLPDTANSAVPTEDYPVSQLVVSVQVPLDSLVDLEDNDLKIWLTYEGVS